MMQKTPDDGEDQQICRKIRIESVKQNPYQGNPYMGPQPGNPYQGNPYVDRSRGIRIRAVHMEDHRVTSTPSGLMRKKVSS